MHRLGDVLNLAFLVISKFLANNYLTNILRSADNRNVPKQQKTLFLGGKKHGW